MSRFLLRSTSWLLARPPLAWAMGLGRLVGNGWYYLVPVRRRIARENVDHVFGDRRTPSERREIVRRSCQNLAMVGIEVLRLPYDMARNESLVAIEGLQHLDAALARGRGVILVCSHAGNIDLLGVSLAVRGYPFQAIVKRASWKALDDFLEATRRQAGSGIIRPAGSRNAFLDALNRNETVLCAIDQHMRPRRGIACSFFGRLASTTPAPTLFALRTGAAILPARLVRTDRPGHHVLHLEPEFHLERPTGEPAADVRHNTERLNRIVERWIEAEPEQWLWHHRRWRVEKHPETWEIPAKPASRGSG